MWILFENIDIWWQAFANWSSLFLDPRRAVSSNSCTSCLFIRQRGCLVMESVENQDPLSIRGWQDVRGWFQSWNLSNPAAAQGYSWHAFFLQKALYVGIWILRSHLMLFLFYKAIKCSERKWLKQSFCFSHRNYRSYWHLFVAVPQGIDVSFLHLNRYGYKKYDDKSSFIIVWGCFRYTLHSNICRWGTRWKD